MEGTHHHVKVVEWGMLVIMCVGAHGWWWGAGHCLLIVVVVGTCGVGRGDGPCLVASAGGSARHQAKVVERGMLIIVHSGSWSFVDNDGGCL